MARVFQLNERTRRRNRMREFFFKDNPTGEAVLHEAEMRTLYGRHMWDNRSDAAKAFGFV
jgi:hypothetical protein